MRFWCFTVLLAETITRFEGEPYLRRLTVFKCPLFGIMLHKFLAPDDDCLHDHPWPFLSLILRGGYWEVDAANVPTWHGPLSLLFRRATWAHRVVPDPSAPRPVTLVVCGPRVREWGFFTRFGWIPWRRYSHDAHCAD